MTRLITGWSNTRPRARLVAWIGLVACIGLVGIPAQAGPPSKHDATYSTVDDLRAVHQSALQLAGMHGTDRVLVVMDIDNTLLAMDQDLGSDQWFYWQRSLQKSEPDSPLLVAREFSGLLHVQGLLYNLGTMHSPQENAAEIVADLQERGFTVIVITSRGPDFRVSTLRELNRNGIDFRRRPLVVNDACHETREPYDLENLSAAGIAADEAERFGLGPARDVVYSDGIYMVAGQHKGAMLLTLLGRCNQQYSAVVFVDDHERHVRDVVDACQGRSIDVRGLRYSREDAHVRRFHEGDKLEVTRKWRTLRETLDEVFGEKRTDAVPIRKAG